MEYVSVSQELFLPTSTFLFYEQFFSPPTNLVKLFFFSGENTRNFLFVFDVATAFDEILHQGVEGHIYNIGGSNEVSVLQVAKDLMKWAAVDL